jgi:phospholipase C
MGPIIRSSQDSLDTLNGSGKCGSASQQVLGQQDRCGVGPRQPLPGISPWAKQNYVDNTFTEQASVVRFIEDNWGLTRIGNGSADATSGTLMNAFDFNQSYGHAPAIILNDTTGEIRASRRRRSRARSESEATVCRSSAGPPAGPTCRRCCGPGSTAATG